MINETSAAATAAAKGASSGAAISAPYVKACILGHPVYLAAVVGILVGAGGYHALVRWREKSKQQAEAT